MLILPERTAVPQAALTRVHSPRSAGGAHGYSTFRACLRWDFGFTCAFCLLHEGDFKAMGAIGVEGFGLTAAEHVATRRDNPDDTNNYANCVYICRLCNGSRSARKLTDRHGRRLLDPTKVAWGAHFEARNDQLVHKAGDRDAEYTESAYDLNEPQKVRMRAMRAHMIRTLLGDIKDQRERIDKYLTIAESLVGSGDEEKRQDGLFLLSEAGRIQRDAAEKRRQLEQWLGVPLDADPKCRCDGKVTLDVPHEVRRQFQVVEDVAMREIRASKTAPIPGGSADRASPSHSA